MFNHENERINVVDEVQEKRSSENNLNFFDPHSIIDWVTCEYIERIWVAGDACVLSMTFLLNHIVISTVNRSLVFTVKNTLFYFW